MLGVYRQTIDGAVRVEPALAELMAHRNHSKAEVELVGEKLLEAQKNDEERSLRMRRKAADLKTLRSRLSETTWSLELQEHSQQENSAARACMQHLAGASQVALSAACVGDAAADAELDALRIEVQGLQSELQDAQ